MALRGLITLFAAALIVVSRSADADPQPLSAFAKELADSATRDPSPLALTATGLTIAGTMVLRFRLTNIGKDTLFIQNRELPWSTGSIVFTAMTRDGRPLTAEDPFWDYGLGPKELQIAPGETLTGDFDLSFFLPPKTLPANAEIVVLWSYSCKPIVCGSRVTPNTGVAVLHTLTRRAKL